MNSLSYNIGTTTAYDNNPSAPYAFSSVTPMNPTISNPVDPNYSAQSYPAASMAPGAYNMSSSVPMDYTQQPTSTPMYNLSQPQNTSGSEMPYQTPASYAPSMGTNPNPNFVTIQPVDTNLAPLPVDSSYAIPATQSQPAGSYSPYMLPQTVNMNPAQAPSQAVASNTVNVPQFTNVPQGMKVITLKKG